MDVRSLIDGQQLVISVADTGVGLTPVRAMQETGTGLGLSNIAQRLRAIYGDAAPAAHTAKCATRLSCYAFLPLTAGDTPAPPSSTLPVGSHCNIHGSDSLPDCRRRTTDAGPHARAARCIQRLRAGRRAGNGADALEKFEATQPDVCFSTFACRYGPGWRWLLKLVIVRASCSAPPMTSLRSRRLSAARWTTC